MPKAPGRGFFVGDTPYAVWEWDLADRNLEFVLGIEHNYFEYLAAVHSQHLEGENRHLAALSIRAAYFHGIETLLTLTCAAVQAPRCVPGWIQRCDTRQLRRLVEEISDGRCIVPNPLRIRPISWEAITEQIINFREIEPTELAEIRSGFAVLWARLAGDWLQQGGIDENNSIKHGLRVRPGGFRMSMGIEHEYGVRPPSEEMRSIGGSEFGTSFFRAEPVANAAENSKTHFRIRRHATNWDPKSLGQALSLVSMSIVNVKAFLSVQNGTDPGEVQVWAAPNKETYSEPWKWTAGVISTDMDTVVSEEHIDRLSKHELSQRIQGHYK